MIDLEKIIQYIKDSLPYLILITGVFYIGYAIAWCVNTFMKYLLKLIGFRPNVIKYSEPEEDEDVLGI
jgi:hypothetical protein|tara:strand:- start:31 stop:234 length:204 start_codon:yes stop_codon:yes gene_type:complete